MAKRIFLMVFIALLALFVLGCEKRVDASSCNYDAPDREYRVLDAKDCETAKFACPEGEAYFFDNCGCGCKSAENIPMGNDTWLGEKRYVGNSQSECSEALFQCSENEKPFFDDRGCGCQQVGGKLQATDCTTAQKEADFCTKEYKPVCGWFDPKKIQCVKYPCARTFGNSCEACIDEYVQSWTDGECPA